MSYNNEDYFDRYRAQLADVTAVLADPETGFDERKLADTERQLLESQLSIHDVDFTIEANDDLLELFQRERAAAVAAREQ